MPDSFLPSHPRRGETVVIRGFIGFAECPDVPPWPYCEERGERWPVNPEWLEPASRPATRDSEQLPLFA